MSLHEQEHIIAAYSFELGKVERMYIREREVNEILANIDLVLATRVAENIGVQPPQGPTVPLRITSPDVSPALSQVNLLPGNIISRKIAILIADGVNSIDIDYAMKEAASGGASTKLIGPSLAGQGCRRYDVYT